MSKGIIFKLIQNIARLSNPHLSKILPEGRPPLQDWRLDDAIKRPKVRHFKPSSSYNKIEDILVDSNKLMKDKKTLDLRRPFNILCLDGGGVKGALTTALLSRISEKNPKFIDNIDFICGTSAGGLLALLLACGYTHEECNHIYSYCAPHIFTYNSWRAISPFRSKYSDKSKQELMQYYFGERTMADLEKTCAVVAFRLDGRKSKTHHMFNKEGWRPAVFSNMPKAAGKIDPDVNLKVWEAAMRTSAAPTYFPIFRGYTDGGIVANNPSIIAATKAMAHYPNISIKNIALLSIGAGNFPRHTNFVQHAERLNGKKAFNLFDDDIPDPSEESSPLWRADWGIKQWIPFLLDILLDGDSVTTEMVMHYLLAGSGMYHRLDPRLPRFISLDDVSTIQELQEFAQTVDISSTLNFIDQNIMFDENTFDNDIYNSLDLASNYHEAWLSTVDPIEIGSPFSVDPSAFDPSDKKK